MAHWYNSKGRGRRLLPILTASAIGRRRRSADVAGEENETFFSLFLLLHSASSFSLQMKKELLLSCAKVGRENKNSTTKQPERLFFQLEASSGPQMHSRRRRRHHSFTFSFFFFVKNIQQSNTHTQERRFTILLLTPQCVFFFFFFRKRWIFKAAAENSLFLTAMGVLCVHSNVYFMYLPNRSFHKFQHSHSVSINGQAKKKGSERRFIFPIN